MGRFDNWKKPVMKHGQLTKWKWLPFYPQNIYIGDKVDIGCFTALFGQNGIILKENVQIGSHCALYSCDTIDEKGGRIVLEKGVCIGSHSTILPGVQIGRNTIVGAHSLVTKSLPRNVIAMGCPAKIIKVRSFELEAGESEK